MKRMLFTATWCGPCLQLKARLPDNHNLEIVDVDSNLDLVKKFGVRTVPTLLIMEGDEVKSKVSGSENISKLIF